jgi:ABC-2 type transport system ATP-binding protein
VRRREGREAAFVRVDGATGDPFEGLPGVTGVSGTPYEAELALAPDADGNAILAALLARGRVRRFEVRTPSLHEIFKRVAVDASPR